MRVESQNTSHFQYRATSMICMRVEIDERDYQSISMKMTEKPWEKIREKLQFINQKLIKVYKFYSADTGRMDKFKMNLQNHGRERAFVQNEKRFLIHSHSTSTFNRIIASNRFRFIIGTVQKPSIWLIYTKAFSCGQHLLFRHNSRDSFDRIKQLTKYSACNSCVHCVQHMLIFTTVMLVTSINLIERVYALYGLSHSLSLFCSLTLSGWEKALLARCEFFLLQLSSINMCWYFALWHT